MSTNHAPVRRLIVAVTILLAGGVGASIALASDDPAPPLASTAPTTPGTATVPASAALAGPTAEQIAPRLLEHYAVLRRPRTSRDAIPSDGPFAQRPMEGSRDAKLDLSRLVADRDGIKVWVIPGKRSVCTVQHLGGGSGGSGCGRTSFDGYYTGHQPMGATIIGPMRWMPRRQLLFLLVPDGTSAARLERKGQTIRPLPIANNAILTRTVEGNTVSWRAPGGTRQRLPLSPMSHTNAASAHPH